MEILEQKIIIRDKTIERLKTELNEVNKLNTILEKQLKEYEKTIQTAEANIRKRFPLLRDEKVIRSKAKAMVDNSKYGPEFARQSGYSMQDREINNLASDLGSAIDSGDSQAKFKAANAIK